MSNKEQLSKQIKIIDDSIYKLNRIAEQIKVKSDDIYIMSQQFDKLRDNFKNLLEVIPDNFNQYTNLDTQVFIRNKIKGMIFVYVMIEISKDILGTLEDGKEYDFVIRVTKTEATNE